MVDFPVVIRNALSYRDFASLNHHLNWEGWLRINTDGKAGNDVSWGHFDLTALILYRTASILNLKAKRFLKCNLSVVKLHINGQTMGQLSNFHQDSGWDRVWTAVLFTNMDWNVNHGGEFTLYNPELDLYQSVSYVPNTVALFPANWEHKGGCPLVPQAGLRTSVAVTFCDSSILDEFAKAHSDLTKFICQ